MGSGCGEEMAVHPSPHRPPPRPQMAQPSSLLMSQQCWCNTWLRHKSLPPGLGTPSVTRWVEVAWPAESVSIPHGETGSPDTAPSPHLEELNSDRRLQNHGAVQRRKAGRWPGQESTPPSSLPESDLETELEGPHCPRQQVLSLPSREKNEPPPPGKGT